MTNPPAENEAPAEKGDTELRPPQKRTLSRKLVDAWKKYQFPVLVAVFSSIVTLAFGALIFQVVAKEFPPIPGIFSRWDTCHYEAIARSGYSAAADRAFQICFYPLFPLLAAPLIPLLGNATLAVLLVANLSCVAAFVCMFRLAEIEFGTAIAKLTVVTVAVFPTSYFFHLGYTESLFLAVFSGSLLAARRNCWAWAGALAFLAALSRMPGMTLVPALFIEYLHQRNFDFRRIRPGILFSLAPFAGIAIYLGLNYRTFGDPFRFLALQSQAFYKKLDWPWVGFMQDWNGLWSADPVSRAMISGPNLAVFFLSTALLIWGFFKLRPCYSICFLGLWFLSFFNSFWMSIPRYILGLPPFFFLIALLLHKRPALQFAAGFTSVLLYGMGLMQFVRGWWAN